MKGVIFTSFMSMVEEKHGYRLVDSLILESKIESNGVYTNIGTYSFSELVKLMGVYSEKTNTPMEVLIQDFGIYLFDKLFNSHSSIDHNYSNLTDLILNIQNTIHTEVKKIYHDAKLPSIIVERIAKDKIKMAYSSDRGLAKLAIGLLYGAAKHFNQKVDIEILELSEAHDFAKIIITIGQND